LTYQEAIAFEECSKLKIAKKEERDSLRKKKTWELVDHPAGQKLVSCKWLFKIKEGIKCVQKPRRYAIGSTKSLLKKEFVMKELGEAKKILGIEIVKDRSRNILRVSQSGHSICCKWEATNVGLVYQINHGNHVEVIGFLDPDYAKDLDKEYMALTEAVKEAIWLKWLAIELGF
ncbi:hypothetical protein Tco_0035403, partial [Tanacetum coccineum]